MPTMHISEADLARDVHGVLALVKLGAEVVIEHNQEAIARLTPSNSPVRRPSIEAIRAAYGKYASAPTSVDSFLARKREDLSLER